MRGSQDDFMKVVEMLYLSRAVVLRLYEPVCGKDAKIAEKNNE